MWHIRVERLLDLACGIESYAPVIDALSKYKLKIMAWFCDDILGANSPKSQAD